MANTLAPFGFAQTSVLNGVAANYANETRAILRTNTTPIYWGDPVTTQSTGSSTLLKGYVAQAVAGTTQVFGIFQGCKRISVSTGMTTWSRMWPGGDAAQDAEAFIIAYPDATFQVQANGQLLPSHIGMNANFALGTGSLATGMSGAMLDVTTIATTNTLPFRITDLVTSPPGAPGADQTSPYGFALVTFNNQDFKSLTGI